jgi:hypothetical protein
MEKEKALENRRHIKLKAKRLVVPILSHDAATSPGHQV